VHSQLQSVLGLGYALQDAEMSRELNICDALFALRSSRQLLNSWWRVCSLNTNKAGTPANVLGVDDTDEVDVKGAAADETSQGSASPRSEDGMADVNHVHCVQTPAAVTRASLYSVCLEEVKRSDDGSNRGSDEAAPSPREDEPTADGKMPPSKPDSSKHMPVCLL